MPAQKPILMSGPMVRAILDGRKTQTRRVIKPQPWPELGDQPGKAWAAGFVDVPCPYGQPGDLLWVRETWQESPFLDNKGEALHRADWNEGRIHPMTWRPSIHMPKWACRIWLRVTDVRVERVQEITGPEALAEGCYESSAYYGTAPDNAHQMQFQKLWNSINAKRGYGWDVNPWVWVVSFERAETP